MICKGTTHNNGAKLARYITTGKDGERAELWQLVGFAPSDIRDAFRSVHVMAEATRCEQPFFHVQVRNPDDEELSRDHWRRVADRIETKLGLTGQPRAICFHTDEKTGHEHMHVAWSRIDGETMTARPLPFFKERLKEVSRELEKKLDLTRVKNERDDQTKAPTRNEFEQARRLGVDIQEVRKTIRDCWSRSDNGGSFEAALREQGLVLAQGDRRDYVIVDHEGGIHALGKRIVDMTSGQVRDRLADLKREELPTVAQARERLNERVPEHGWEKRQPNWNRDRANERWDEALIAAAIEKEKIERQFVDPKPKKNRRDGGREEEGRGWAETAYAPGDKFRDAGLETLGSTVTQKPLRGIEKHLWAIYRSCPHMKEFAGALDERGINFASVSRDEAYKSYREAQFAKAIGRMAPAYREGEIVVVRAPGDEYLRHGEWTELNRVQKLDQAHAKKYLETLGLDKSKLKGIGATKTLLEIFSKDRATYWESIRRENAQKKIHKAPSAAKKIGRKAALNAGTRVADKTLRGAEQLLEGVLAPVLTPEQKRQGEIAARLRKSAAEESADLSRSVSDAAEERRRKELEDQARHWDRGGRDR